MAAKPGSHWGYIEGYYGRLPTWEERETLAARVGALGGNAYLYAPKEDALHRRDWRAPYPAEWRRRFARLTARSRARGVEVIPGMAPGLSFRYLDRADYRALLRKLSAFAAMGCRTLALLMDDIPPELPADCRRAFRTLGEAHGILLSRLAADLGPDIRLWFCPTVYTDQFASGPVERDPYLRDLADLMPPEVPLLWTGPRIVSPRLSGRELKEVSRLFRGNLILWDNLYANDYCPQKLFGGPFAGRSADLRPLTRGVLLNPTGMPVTDAFLLGLLARFRRGEAPKRAWAAELAKLAAPAAFRQVADYLASPFFSPPAGGPSPRKVAAMRKALKTLIWDWKGPLHVEWYPHLFMLDADLKASARGAEAPDAAWIRKRYPPLIARLLLKRA